MRLISAFFLSVCFFCVVPNNSFSYQLDEFTWGMPLKESRELLFEKGKTAIRQSGESLFFADTVFGEPCVVKLDFTPENSLLTMVSLQWKNSGIGSLVRDAYIKRYGPPSKKGGGLFSYRWVEKTDKKSFGDSISLDYSGKNVDLVFSQGGLEAYQ